MALINKQKAIDEIKYFQAQLTCDFSNDYEAGMNEGFDHAIGVIELIETVDAEPVRHGKWIDEGQYADFLPHHAWRCSECGEHVIDADTPWGRYCSNCGAKMDGKKNEKA
ncbi:MAG: hypothetical protein IKG37_04390 [Solobacterium sp.]|nr:hypothetical protein [Solobacterium sp.]